MGETEKALYEIYKLILAWNGKDPSALREILLLLLVGIRCASGLPPFETEEPEHKSAADRLN